MSIIKERIEVFRELPNLRQNHKEISLRLESLERIRSGISAESYEELKKNLTNQRNELNGKIEDLQSGLDALRAELELDTKMLMSEISLLEKELQEVQFLFQSNAISKEDFSARSKALRKNINEKNKTVQENLNSGKKLEIYSTSIGEQNSAVFSLKDKAGAGNFARPALGKIKLPDFLKSGKAIGIAAGLILILIVYLLAFNKSTPYSEILPSSYSKLHLGMTLDQFHSVYPDRDYREEYNRDGSLSVTFRLNKVTDYKWFNSWELEFQDEILYHITGMCTYESDIDELCRMANEVNDLVKEENYTSIGQNATYMEFSDCVSIVEYYFKLKEKGMPDNYQIRIINDLNARKWSRDPFRILIWTE